MHSSITPNRLKTLVTVLFLAAIPFAGAQPDTPKEKDKDKKDDFPKFEEVTKDLEVQEGFFTLYYDKKKDVLLGRIPKAMLKENFLLGVSIPKGPTFAGWMMGGGAVYWDRLDKKLVLMECNTQHRRDKNSTVEDAVGRTYTDTILAALEIKTEAPGGDPVIDLGELMKSDIVGLTEMYGNRRLDGSLSRWSTHKAFPDNVELSIDAALMSKEPTEGGLIASVHLSASRLPKNDYKPREADDRIGYFMTAQKDWTTDHNHKTLFKRYVHRWNLEKQDPKAAVSPVKDPIIFYVEKTVPIKFRRYVREGIEEWNKAFEKIGLLDAVQARQQTDTNQFKDLDPEDNRYNFFRWIVSGRAFARGPSRVNPFTGQILDADIVFDDSMARFQVQEFHLMGPKAYETLSDPVAEEFFRQNPEYQYTPLAEALTPQFAGGTALAVDDHIVDPSAFLRQRGEHVCELGVGMVQQMAFSQLLSAQNGVRDLPEEFVGQIIKEITAHEVGHTLGLRHNFKASSWLKLSEVLSSSAEERPVSGSVMDYNPAEYAAAKGDQGDFVTRTLGPYDYWAIEYGYRTFLAGGEQKSEEEMLKAITSRVSEAGLAYATDEDTSDFGPDPFVYRYDNGDDPLTYAKLRMELAARLTKDLQNTAVEDGESYARLRRAFNIVMGEHAFGARIAARLVGGQNVHRDHKGDPNARPPFQILPAAKQREALKFLEEQVFSDAAYRFPPELLNRLAPGRFGHWESDQMDTVIDYNWHDRVLAIQASVLTILINPFIINRVYDAELKVPESEDALTVPELVGSVTGIVWSEIDKPNDAGRWTNRTPAISSFRRNLQRLHLERLITVLLSEPGQGLNADAHAVVRMNVADLGRKISALLDKSRAKLDAYTMAHLDEADHRIKKALDADFVDGASRAARSNVIVIGQETASPPTDRWRR